MNIENIVDLNKEESVNRNIDIYLQHYAYLQYSPYYAVMLNGSWGTGKTFFIKNFLSNHLLENQYWLCKLLRGFRLKWFPKKNSYLYVSLYGLSSIEEINCAILSALYKRHGEISANISDQISRFMIKNLPIFKSLIFRNLATIDRDCLLVFDDVERSKIPVDLLLGFLNVFVEHEGRKVILIANETELANRSENYKVIREKIIGRTLKLEFSFDEAYRYFVKSLEDKKTKCMFSKHASIIKEVTTQSGTDNFRILQQTMWDFERVFKILSSRLKNHEIGIPKLLQLFFALSFEIRAGRLEEDDLRDRINKFVKGNRAEENDDEEVPLFLADRRYENIHLYSDLLSDVLLIDILINGRIFEDDINFYLDNSDEFSPEYIEPNWKIVRSAWRISQEKFDVACQGMEKDFIARKVQQIEHVLEIFGVRLWLSEIGQVKKSKAEIVSECQKYVDDLCSNNLIGFQGRYGLVKIDSIMISSFSKETPEFISLVEYLEQHGNVAIAKDFFKYAEELLNLLTDDLDRFVYLICMDNGKDKTYAYVPVLGAMDIDRFLEIFFSLDPIKQKEVMTALKVRYEALRLVNELVEEREWLTNLRDKFLDKSVNMGALDSFRTEKYVELYLNVHLNTGS